MRGDSWRRESGCGDQVAELVEGSLRLVVAVIAMPSRACWEGLEKFLKKVRTLVTAILLEHLNLGVPETICPWSFLFHEPMSFSTESV